MFLWIYDYPIWAMALVFTFGFAAAGVLGLALFRRYALEWLHRDARANDMVGFAMSSFAMLYGLLLGLLAVAAYGDYSTASDLVDSEASSVAALYRDAGGYPEPTRSELQAELRAYVRDVIHISWPQQRKGILPSKASADITRFFRTIQAFKPAHAGEQVLHAEAYRQANNVVELRRKRLAIVNVGIPNIMWSVVLVGAFINVLLVWMLRMSRHMHIVLTGLLAGFLGLVIYLVAAMDYPFRGDVAVGPDAFEEVYQSMMAGDE